MEQMTHLISANDPAENLPKTAYLGLKVGNLHQSHDANDSAGLQRFGLDKTQFLPQINCRETAVHIQLVQDVLGVITDS
jgi:hypothetical protein